MKFPGVKRRPPSATLPRHKRSHEVIRLKGKMRRVMRPSTAGGSPVVSC